MGKPLSEAAGEAEFCGDIFDYFADQGPTLLADQPIRRSRRRQGRRPEAARSAPLLGIMPWNYPFYQIARFAAPNLMLGNTIVLKHAESVPALGARGRAAHEGRRRARRRLRQRLRHARPDRDIIADPRIAGVSLTGSERAGAVVAAIAGKNLKKCVLELGGSDPYVILDTDDVAAAADAAGDAPDQQHRPGLQLQQAHDRHGRRLRRLRRAAHRAREGPGAGRPDARGRGIGPLSSRRAAEPWPSRWRTPSARAPPCTPAACSATARRPTRAGRAHRHHPGHARLPRGALRPGGRGLQGLRRRRGARPGQRHGVRARRRGVQHRPGARAARSPSASRSAWPTSTARPARARRCPSAA